MGEHSVRGRGTGFLRSNTEEETREAHNALGRLFLEVEAWQARIGETHPIHVRSAIGFADQISEPFQTSHTVSYLRLTAVDHLHGLRTLMKEAQAQHIFAPFSLIRSALETAAAALWILADPNPRTMAIRSLKNESASMRDRVNAYKTIGRPEDELSAHVDTFEKVIERERMQGEGIRARSPGYLKTINDISAAFELGTTPALMWQMCSGAAHGRNWVTGFLTMMESDDDGISKILSGRLTSDEKAITLATHVACDLVRRLFGVQEIRARSEEHTGSSFQRSPELIVPPRGLYVPRLRKT